MHNGNLPNRAAGDKGAPTSPASTLYELRRAQSYLASAAAHLERAVQATRDLAIRDSARIATADVRGAARRVERILRFIGRAS